MLNLYKINKNTFITGKEYGISAPISMCLNGKRKTAYGRQWFREIEI